MASKAAAKTLASIAPTDQAAAVVTKRAAHCIHNFGPASTRDETLFTSERPGGDPDEDGEIKDTTVVEWINFMKGREITDVLLLLDDNELEITDVLLLLDDNE